MKTPKLMLCVALSALLSPLAHADLVGPYTPDANTLYLFHFDEAAGGTAANNYGSKGGVSYSVNENPASTTPPTVTTMLGAAGYVNGPTNFNLCMTNPTTSVNGGYEFGYDFNKSGAYEGDIVNTASADALAMTNLNMGYGGQSPWTLEALIQPSTTAGSQEIICTDNSLATASRGFQFRIYQGTFQIQWVGGASPNTVSGNIPTTGPDAFVAGTWYHVAATYDGTTVTLYWTKLDPANGAAHVLYSGAMVVGTTRGAVKGPLIIGNENRNVAGEQFLGSIDEVRISSVCRAANQMQFYAPVVTITQNPISQNVDYNQPVSFTVGASTTGSTLGYQWLFNSNGIAGATNATYAISNVAAANAGYYHVVVTNTAGYAATSSVAQLVVGAANFLNHRYSFTTSFTDPTSGLVCTPDTISGATGTNFGNAVEANGSLVLDGTTGTYLQLPANIVNGANQTALTVEFWATYGVNPNNVYVFNFGFTNNVNGGIAHSYVGYTPHSAAGQVLAISPSDPIFAYSNTASGTFDGLTMHVACVIDPPNQTLSIYTNGVLESTGTAAVGLASVNDVLSYIGASLNTVDPYLVANIDEFRIFNGALSPITIKQSDDQGPNTILADGPAKFVVQPVNTTVPVGQTATLTAAAVGYLPITYQWFKNGVLLPGATNASLSFAGSLADNNASFVCYATNTIGVTTYVVNSATASLAVYLPPTLSWLGSANGGADDVWNTTSLDWVNDATSSAAMAFTQTNGVLFDDRSGGGTVDLEQTIIPYKITANAADSYTLTSSGNAGSLAGQGYLTKLNSGTFVIDLTNNLSGPTTISGGVLQIGNNDSLGTLGAGPVTNNAKLSFARADTILAVGNAIHGSGTVSFESGAITMTGNSDYSGSTLLNNSSVVYLTSSTGLGSTTGGTTVASGAQLYVTANIDFAERLSLAGSGGDGNGALRKGGAGATTENGALALALDATIGVDGGATLTLSNGISGSATLSAVGSGTLALCAPSTFSGGFTLNGPIVDLNANGALGTGQVTVGGSGRFMLGSGVTVTNFILASTVSPAGGAGLLMVNDNTNGIVTTVSGPLEFDSSPANGGDFYGPTSSGYLNVTGPITNTATGVVSSREGKVRLSGGGNYTLFQLNAGTLSLGAPNGVCSNASLSLSISAASVFDLNGFDQTLTGLLDGGTFSKLVTNSASSPAVLSLDLSSGDTYGGVIGGNLALVENGSASLYLSGTNNTYTGDTTVNGGTLELAQPCLAARSTVRVASGALLQLDFTTTNTVTGLVLGGVNQPLGLYNNTTSPSYISGSGYLLVAQTVATNPTNIVASVSGNTLNLSWPADHTGWRLLVQTSNLAGGLSANANDWTMVSGSANTNRVQITIDPAKPMEFYRMVYP